jgi:hypothetical protein
MIKNITIIILILLLIISFYSYYCLGNSMVNFEDDAMNYIYEKEHELKERETKIGSMIHCQNQNDSYQSAMGKIFNLSRPIISDIIHKNIPTENNTKKQLNNIEEQPMSSYFKQQATSNELTNNESSIIDLDSESNINDSSNESNIVKLNSKSSSTNTMKLDIEPISEDNTESEDE